MFCPALYSVQRNVLCAAAGMQRPAKNRSRAVPCCGRIHRRGPVPLCFFDQAGLEEVVLLLRDISPVTKA